MVTQSFHTKKYGTESRPDKTEKFIDWQETKDIIWKFLTIKQVLNWATVCFHKSIGEIFQEY